MTADLCQASAFTRSMEFVREKEFLTLFAKGTVVALSGGADSVFLLLFMKHLSEENGFPLYALHVHHGIRGAEADRDAEFCRALCEQHKISFEIRRVETPLYAQNNKMGIEEAARELRYAAMDSFAAENHCSAVVTAHHADDNLETVLLHMLRGSGIRGMTGIPPRRGIYLRPLLSVGKSEITDALMAAGIPFVEDSSNADTAYARNDLRTNVLPVFYRLTPHPEAAVFRMTQSLRNDMEYLDRETERIFREGFHDGSFSRALFSSLHTAIASRVFFRMAREISFGGPQPEERHARDAILLARGEKTTFSLSLPGGTVFVGDRNIVAFRDGDDRKTVCNDKFPVFFPESLTPDGELLFIFSAEREKFVVRNQNVYKFLKQIHLSRDTMEGEIYVRHRKVGDRYTYGGMTHSLRKMLIDRKYTQKEKDALWILCDRRGIVWTPCGSVRDGEGSERFATVTVYKREAELPKIQ